MECCRHILIIAIFILPKYAGSIITKLIGNQDWGLRGVILREYKYMPLLVAIKGIIIIIVNNKCIKVATHDSKLG